MLVYNIGYDRIIIQEILGMHNSYIYSMPENEQFFGFVKFEKVESIAFITKNLNMEASSMFVFLTKNKKTNLIKMNTMLIDPYYDSINIVLFKSNKFFKDSSCGCLDREQAYQKIVFNTSRSQHDTMFEIRLMIQNHNAMVMTSLALMN